MASEATPLGSDIEVDNSLPRSADIEDVASIDSDTDTHLGTSPTPFEDDILDEDILGIPDTQPAAYSLRKRTERRTASTFLDQDTSGNFDPATEKKFVKTSKHRSLKEARKQGIPKIRNAGKKNKSKFSKTQKQAADTGRKPSNSKASTVGAKDKVSRFNNHIEPMRPEDYLTKEDFEAEDPEDLRIQMQLGARSPSPNVLEDNAGHRGVVTQIKTSFAHPIEFCVESAAAVCNFCEIPSYGFVGSFEKEIYCIRWDNELGFTQLAVTSGNAEATSTTMCHDCILARAHVVLCEGHDIRYVPPDTLDFAEALENLLAHEDPAMIKQQLYRWCSMCFAPATHACHRTNPSLSTEGKELSGCGLRLCTPCKTRLRETFDGDSDAMASTLDQESKAREGDEDLHGKVRADVGFLCKEGILMKNLASAAEESADNDAAT